MKINITNIYGMSGQSTALIAQNETVKIARKLDFHELGFYFYDIYSDSQGELNSRLDGVMAKSRLRRYCCLSISYMEWERV